MQEAVALAFIYMIDCSHHLCRLLWQPLVVNQKTAKVCSATNVYFSQDLTSKVGVNSGHCVVSKLYMYAL